ncbi:MAG: PQQ-dependent sugar dehydrogenase [Coriobacteriia bacterium]|nr:PQQ-dependent sugar dehydrogenase [Coriobacteriia bacterium]
MDIRRIVVPLLVCASVALAGCSRAEPRVLQPPSPTPPPASVPTSAPVSLTDVEVSLQPVAEGFDRPVFVTHAGDGSGRLYVVEQSGSIRVIAPKGAGIAPFLDVSELISDGGERGLLGLAFSPDYASSGDFYVNYTDRDGATVVASYRAMDPAALTPKLATPATLLRIEQPYSNHNGGCIAFDEDGLLWIGMGDGGSGGDPEDRAQNPKSLLGKMLTLDVSKPGSKPRIAITGVRNPWRFSFDRSTGDLWIADVGQNAWEEVHLLQAGSIDGANLGWNLWEGSHPYPEGSNPSRKGFVFPVAEYGHDEGRSITGGYVYRGSESPGLTGAYVFADFEAGWIGALAAMPEGSDAGPRTPVRLVDDAGQPSSFGEDEAGELYVCDYASGTVSKVVARAR